MDRSSDKSYPFFGDTTISGNSEQEVKRQKIILSCDSKYGLELEKYDTMKKKLAAIMRDFSNNLVHFKYQKISLECQSNNKQPSEFIKGETLKFKTNYSKSTSVFTITELFIPEFEIGRKPNVKKKS